VAKITTLFLCFFSWTFVFAASSNGNLNDTIKNRKSVWFDFGTSVKNSKGTIINTALVYDPNMGYGFDFNTVSNIKMDPNSFSTKKPTYFSVKLPEGNYQIEVVMGNSVKESNATIKAESRRLMLNQLAIQKGKSIKKIFNINIRTPKIDDNQNITLKDREKYIFDWDDKLTLEFLGEVSIQSIKITLKDNLTVVYLAGDSTVTDQDVEPWASWGQFITNYFDTNIVVANYAYSGSSLSSIGKRKRRDSGFGYANTASVF
jgi:hypothetical protein